MLDEHVGGAWVLDEQVGGHGCWMNRRGGGSDTSMKSALPQSAPSFTLPCHLLPSTPLPPLPPPAPSTPRLAPLSSSLSNPLYPTPNPPLIHPHSRVGPAFLLYIKS